MQTFDVDILKPSFEVISLQGSEIFAQNAQANVSKTGLSEDEYLAKREAARQKSIDKYNEFLRDGVLFIVEYTTSSEINAQIAKLNTGGSYQRFVRNEDGSFNTDEKSFKPIVPGEAGITHVDSIESLLSGNPTYRIKVTASDVRSLLSEATLNGLDIPLNHLPRIFQRLERFGEYRMQFQVYKVGDRVADTVVKSSFGTQGRIRFVRSDDMDVLDRFDAFVDSLYEKYNEVSESRNEATHVVSAASSGLSKSKDNDKKAEAESLAKVIGVATGYEMSEKDIAYIEQNLDVDVAELTAHFQSLVPKDA